jgi:DNA-binding LacI/PurR family transcriptional regulator
MGHTRIGYLCCAPTDLQEMGKSRREGFERALFDHDLPLIGRDIYSGGDGKRGGYQAMRKLLEERKDDLPTAFFCHNDDIALGAMLAIQQAGLSVPEDFSLIGFDDIDEGRLSCPALTTVGNVKNELAQNLVEVILDVSKNKTASNLIKKEIVPELIIRETVKNIKKGVSQNGTNHLKNK